MEERVALARAVTALSSIADVGADLHVTLTLTQPVLWRLFTLETPTRLVIEFGEVAFDDDIASIANSANVAALSAGATMPGWSRLVLQLARPMAVETAGMTTGADDGSAVLRLQLMATDAASFSQSAGWPQIAGIAPTARTTATTPADGRPVIVVDAGHGGIDPGAQADGIVEAEVMLALAKDLAGLLEARGFRAVLTRSGDVFVPLETRMSIARQAGASAFLSLHADALAQGRASGATVYTLAPDATDLANRIMSERHDRADLLAGVDLAGHDDEIASVLMSLARTETQPSADRLADLVVQGLAEATDNLHKRPRMSATFSVLKSADIPSVLIEVGYLSSPDDRADLLSPDWRATAAAGIAAAVELWHTREVERAALNQQ